ncbi:MAG: associated Golgi protein domain protein [Parcubacteria group bacterium]|nr:associated Golgi protein domain protein [Parcubacteria group bacterium]
MDLFAFITHTIDSALGSSTLLLSLAIIICAFLLEDISCIIVGLLAADGIVSIPLAAVSLYIGIVLGDTVLYSLGAIARTHPRLAQYIDHDFTSSFRSWLDRRYALTIFSAHFVPGLRFTSYVASGFFRYPLSRYIPAAIAGGLLLGTALFSLSYWFGNATAEWLGPARWIIAAAFLLVFFFIGRRNLYEYRLVKQESDIDVDTRVR